MVRVLVVVIVAIAVIVAMLVMMVVVVLLAFEEGRFEIEDAIEIEGVAL